MARVSFLRRLLAVLALSACCAAYPQESYPSRPVKIVVPLGPGAATDSLARLISESLRSELKGSFIVENRPGAGGIVGAAYVASAKPDGYTIGVFHSSVLSAAAAVNPKLGYDPKKDFTPIGIVASNPIALAVAANSKFRTLDDFIAAAKKEPGKYTAGFIGLGSHSHFNLELLRIASSAEITRVPFAGGTGPLITSLLGGQIDAASALWAAFSGQVQGGKLRLIATTSPIREHPEVPTFASKGYPKLNLEVLAVVVGPAGMPTEAIGALVRAVERATVEPKNVAAMEKLGFQVAYGGPQKLASYIAEELAVLSALVKDAGIKLSE
jgi:tripartite-type tricarboxylate transporter receptor subunit TctC